MGFGAVAQLGERLVRNEKVAGSIPVSSTITYGDEHQSYNWNILCIWSLRYIG